MLICQRAWGVLREAIAAVADAGVEEVSSAARISADYRSHGVDVRAAALTLAGDPVDESDPHGYEGVGSVLGELGAAAVHFEHENVARRLLDG